MLAGYTKPTQEQEEIGRKLRAMREAKGLTQRKLGRLINMSKTQISRMEHGHITDLWAIQDAFAALEGKTPAAVAKKAAEKAAEKSKKAAEKAAEKSKKAAEKRALGENIRRMRIELGLTRRELGRRCGFSETHVHSIEHGGGSEKSYAAAMAALNGNAPFEPQNTPRLMIAYRIKRWTFKPGKKYTIEFSGATTDRHFKNANPWNTKNERAHVLEYLRDDGINHVFRRRGDWSGNKITCFTDSQLVGCEVKEA